MLNTSSFSVGQMLQMILPTIIALFLFTPFFETPGHRISATTLVLSGIVLGYLISDLIREVAKHVIESIPKFRRRLKEYKKRRDLVESNWRLDYLEAHLSKDDREAVDIVGHNLIFTQVVSFYLLAYLVFNLVRLIGELTSARSELALGTNAFGLAQIWGALERVNTPMFGGWQVLTIVVIPASLVVTIFSLHDYLEKYKQIFLPGGLYDTQAEKYQRDKGNIATSVWGRVTKKANQRGKEVDNPIRGLVVHLVEAGNVECGKSETDGEGYFQFEGAFKICLKGCRRIELADTCKIGEKNYSVVVSSPTALAITLADEKAVPFFAVTVALKEEPGGGRAG